MPNHGNVNNMPKTTSKITKAPAPTKPKTGKITKKKAAGKITKKKAEITDFDANLFEPIPITAIEHIATKVRFAKDENVRIFNASTSIPFWASTSILNPPTTITSNATTASILKVRTNPPLAAITTDAPPTIPNTTMEEPAEEEKTTTTTDPTDTPSTSPTVTIKEEPTEGEANTHRVILPTDAYDAVVLKKEPVDQTPEEVAVDQAGNKPPPPKPTSPTSSTKTPSSSTKSDSSSGPPPLLLLKGIFASGKKGAQGSSLIGIDPK